MAQIIRLILDGDGAFSDLAGHEDRIIHLTGVFTIASLEKGMVGGAPSIAIRIDLPDGKTVIQETSVRAFMTAAEALKAKYHQWLH